MPWRRDDGWRWPAARRGARRRLRAAGGLLAGVGAAIARRPAWAALTTLGALIGVGSVVATLGLASTAAARVDVRLDGLRPADVTVRDRDPARPDPPFPADAEARLARLTGVRAAGLLWTARPAKPGVRGPEATAEPGAAVALPVVAATPGALAAAGAAAGRGRLYDRFHERRGEPVALVGADAARRLHVGDLGRRPAVFVGDRALTVIGVVDRADRRPDLLGAVIVPAGTATRMWGLEDARREVVIHTDRNAARLVAAQAPLALRPQDPGRLAALVTPEPDAVRRDVHADLGTLFLLLAGLSLAVGAVGVANAALLSALDRRREIALRLALGVPRRHVAAQLLAEGAALGTFGGLLGAVAGTTVVVLLAAAFRWQVVVEPAAVLLTPLLGTLTGVLAALYPALVTTAAGGAATRDGAAGRP
jgi:putative ABC transport system permease protein